MNPERERKQNPLPENTAPGNAGEHSLLHSRGAFWLRLILDVLATALMFGVFYLFLAILPQQRQLEVRKAAMGFLNSGVSKVFYLLLCTVGLLVSVLQLWENR